MAYTILASYKYGFSSASQDVIPRPEIYNDTYITGASPGFGRGGQEFFFFRFGNLHVAKRHAASPCALVGGSGGMLPRENFLKQCNLVRFRVYFDQI